MEQTDSLTWKLYLDKNWHLLLKESENAFRKGLDFYYLRIRAGVAAYELKKYRKAAFYLQKAFTANEKDDFVNSYYYWALAMSGREDEAACLADRFTSGFLNQNHIRRRGKISGITAGSLLSFNTGFNDLLAEDIEENDSYSNYRSVLKQQQYVDFALDHHLMPRLNLYHNLSYIGIDRMQQYKSTLNLLDTTKETSTTQYQYYISGRFLVSRGWSFFTSATRLWGKSYYHEPQYQSAGVYNLIENSLAINDFLFIAGVSKEMIYFRPKLDVGFGKINQSGQFQANMQVIIYPFGKAGFYFLPEGSLHMDGNDGKTRFIYTQKAGLKTGPVWLTGEFSRGYISNFYSNEGLVVYNMPERIRNRTGITLWAPLIKYRLGLTAKYLISSKEGTTFVYSDLSNYVTTPYTFTDQSFLISLKWNL
jgi:hypothetical protein